MSGISMRVASEEDQRERAARVRGPSEGGRGARGRQQRVQVGPLPRRT